MLRKQPKKVGFAGAADPSSGTSPPAPSDHLRRRRGRRCLSLSEELPAHLAAAGGARTLPASLAMYRTPPPPQLQVFSTMEPSQGPPDRAANDADAWNSVLMNACNPCGSVNPMCPTDPCTNKVIGYYQMPSKCGTRDSVYVPKQNYDLAAMYLYGNQVPNQPSGGDAPWPAIQPAPTSSQQQQQQQQQQISGQMAGRFQQAAQAQQQTSFGPIAGNMPGGIRGMAPPRRQQGPDQSSILPFQQQAEEILRQYRQAPCGCSCTPGACSCAMRNPYCPNVSGCCCQLPNPCCPLPVPCCECNPCPVCEQRILDAQNQQTSIANFLLEKKDPCNRKVDYCRPNPCCPPNGPPPCCPPPCGPPTCCPPPCCPPPCCPPPCCPPPCCCQPCCSQGVAGALFSAPDQNIQSSMQNVVESSGAAWAASTPDMQASQDDKLPPLPPPPVDEPPPAPVAPSAQTDSGSFQYSTLGQNSRGGDLQGTTATSFGCCCCPGMCGGSMCPPALSEKGTMSLPALSEKGTMSLPTCSDQLLFTEQGVCSKPASPCFNEQAAFSCLKPCPACCSCPCICRCITPYCKPKERNLWNNLNDMAFFVYLWIFCMSATTLLKFACSCFLA